MWIDEVDEPLKNLLTKLQGNFKKSNYKVIFPGDSAYTLVWKFYYASSTYKAFFWANDIERV